MGRTLLSVAFDLALELDEISTAASHLEERRFSAASDYSRILDGDRFARVISAE